MTAGLETGEIEQMMDLLGRTKASVADATRPRGRSRAE
jgi:hypothetical protein